MSTYNFCDICKSKIYGKDLNFKKHLRRHPECKGCRIICLDKDDLLTHMSVCTAIIEDKCNDCNKRFYNITDFNKHKIECRVCKAKVCNIGKHLKSHPKCECGRYLIDDEALIEHKKSHTLCRICDINVINIKQHLTTHPKCKCGKILKDHGSLNEHQKYTKCNICNLDILNCMWNNHVNKHNPYTCILLGCKFISLDREDVVKHTLEVHSCNICKENFPNLEEHIKLKHTDYPKVHTDWVIIKCDDHKNVVISREQIKRCNKCKWFKRKV